MVQSTTSTPTAEENSLIPVDDLATMADDFFTAMLGLEFRPEPIEADPDFTPDLQAVVQIRGEWNADLRIFASEDLAKRVAAAMFGLSVDDLPPEKVHDALGEVANVMGGNVKGFINGDCTLSLPQVGVAKDYAAGCHLTCLCDGSPITISWVESTE